uniref:NADH dehydrogenase subunit 2 n=1 Tax=Daclera levana TaxID=2924069 RepID=UPI001FA7A0B0|nr:NADH dehydrogenase subunit 2 [Daclera levana]UMY75896.1 NADH dehydrogenase subunit 2 [Daclera levana]
MNLNLSKMIFLFLLIISSLLTLSSNNWLGMWMGLEINLMSFIPLISKSKNKNLSQAMMIYFLTQSIGSIILLFSILMMHLVSKSVIINEIMMTFMMISIMIKVGAAPFHLWMPMMMSSLPWFEASLLMTWQKLAPLYMMYNINWNIWIMYSAVMMSATIGAIGGLNQTSLRKILAYSSINHLGWMMSFMTMSNYWYKYLIIYSTLIFMLCILLSENNLYFLNQMNSNSSSLMNKYLFIILLLSIGGLPPFLGFLPKWMVILNMIESQLYMLIIYMLLMSLITLFYYLRMVSYMILFYSTMNTWMNYKNMNKLILYLIYMINCLLPIFSIMYF